jgi:hypothetical protein
MGFHIPSLEKEKKRKKGFIFKCTEKSENEHGQRVIIARVAHCS